MIKKIVLISIFVLFAGVLIAGGLNRTSAKTGYETRSEEENHAGSAEHENDGILASGQTAGSAERQQSAGSGQGQGNGGAPQGGNQNAEKPDRSAPQGIQGQGVQNEQGQGVRGQNQENERAVEAVGAYETVILEGEVIQSPAAGVDLILNTGVAEVLIGTGPGYLQEQGFELAVGQSAQVSGFWEDDEFKATTITRLADGLSIALRDEFGRPMWSGAARGGRGVGNQSQGSQADS